MSQEDPEYCEQCDKENVDLFSYYGSWICSECCAEDDPDFVEFIE